ncbi:MAG: alanyl-tRNA editing protein [Oscillospiraceae bacterium]|nr:alanyl-tRNA editing protein [Oscillospiraceae bacterium]
METIKLYYEDSHLQTFTATVRSCAETEKGFLVTLDATAFYPEGGGQACDLGRLGNAHVLDVREKEGKILHLCNKPLEVGAQVEGHIDWQRRFDLMQQHSGEHIVSGIVHRMFGWHNVGFHMGSGLMTIDFDGPISPEALMDIENQANRAVWENLPVRCWYPDEELLPTIPYRSKKALPWPVRIVDIPGMDLCACCGTHVKYTGEIGLIKLVSCIKFHQGVRIEMACGRKALVLTQQVFEQNRQVSQAFSAKMLETGAAAQKMNEALAVQKLRANTLQTAVFDRMAAAFAGKGNVWHFADGLTPGETRELADKIAAVCGGWAAVLSGEEDNYSLCIVSKVGDVKALGTHLGARGGGKPGFFQGSLRAQRSQIEALLKAL